jgi:DNA invertase Pin-like site-specific DNA recombinase
MSAPAATSIRALPTAASGLIPVVAYVRMSTEPPHYSTEHQLDRIREFAAGRGMEIIRVFADDTKINPGVRSRESLRQLIAEVVTGQAGFNGILVYDVSRWGRFQDAGESDYYEYVCQRAGITVHYCAEETSA